MSVADVLSLLPSGATSPKILAHYPYMTIGDIKGIPAVSGVASQPHGSHRLVNPVSPFLSSQRTPGPVFGFVWAMLDAKPCSRRPPLPRCSPSSCTEASRISSFH